MSDDKPAIAILAVDYDATNLRVLRELLKHPYKVYAAPSGERALTFLGNNTPDLILLDTEMREMRVCDLVKHIKNDPRLSSVPILFLTVQNGYEREGYTFECSADDYILKPVSKNAVLARVNLNVELENYRKRFDSLVREKTNQLSKVKDSILDMLANASAWRSSGIAGRPDRAAVYARAVLEGLARCGDTAYSISQVHGEHIIKASKLRDIGKAHVADNILMKPGKLTREEFSEIKKHTEFGALMIDAAIRDLGDDSSFLPVAREIVITHHEWWDGSGYPRGLSGDAIPVCGRVSALTDMYDSLTSVRPYRGAMTHDEAVSVIYGETGTHFDPKMIELLEDTFPRFTETSGGV
jgi:putative two-component system response regulator